MSKPVTVRSFAKINLGLSIGALRPDGYHDLRTVYQTVALHDVLHVQVKPGTGIEIRCEDPRVPRDAGNTCWKIAERVMAALKASGRVEIEIEKRLPVQGGLGGASANAVGVLLALQRRLRKHLPGEEALRLAAEVGSDLPLFLMGGTVLGVGRGEEVFPLPDLPAVSCVIATPAIGVSTPQAFADWDLQVARAQQDEVLGLGTYPAYSLPADTTALRKPSTSRRPGGRAAATTKLTLSDPSDRMIQVGRALSAWLSGWPQPKAGKVFSGVSAGAKRGDLAESPLLDLVRTGIENDFEQVVFPQHPELRQVKGALVRAGAFYASLSGSGSALYGLFRSHSGALRAAARLRKQGIPAQATATLGRREYAKKIFG
ncbi:MAG: 4-(cytidine 5'-diphospho)-2-C-methyl-D-erythritol kinase [Acidobacteria bacterium]|nr:4-(cytidine 5'-diphospho)-2-C-methyl-D-erythritol kinase [Acidobacteriota bacterium]